MIALIRSLLLIFALPAAAQAAEPKAVMAENLALLQEMAAGARGFDAAVATTARSDLASATVGMLVAQQSGTLPQGSADDFAPLSEALLTQAEALDSSSLSGLRAGLPGLETACSACHALP